MEKKIAKVILNETHSLLPDQERVLNRKFSAEGWEILPVPAEGWTLEEIDRVASSFSWEPVVFVSPVPALLSDLAWAAGAWNCPINNHRASRYDVDQVFVMHNDRREAKEVTLPNGQKKVIHSVAKTGWVLV